MQTHYNLLTDSQWQIMKTILPIQSAPKGSSKGVPWTFGKGFLWKEKENTIYLTDPRDSFGTRYSRWHILVLLFFGGQSSALRHVLQPNGHRAKKANATSQVGENFQRLH